MPKVDPEKQARAIEQRQRQIADCLRLHESGLTRADIARITGLHPSIVTDRLEVAGVAREPVSQPWTDKEVDILRQVLDITPIPIDRLLIALPRRSRTTIYKHIKEMRQAEARAKARAMPPRRPTLAEPRQPAEPPAWPIPPGAYRDRRGITLPKVSILEARA